MRRRTFGLPLRIHAPYEGVGVGRLGVSGRRQPTTHDAIRHTPYAIRHPTHLRPHKSRFSMYSSPDDRPRSSVPDSRITSPA